METCDDCRQQYDGPAFYAFDEEACEWSENEVIVPHDCTGNLCPECAGPHLEPDDENDPRRLLVTTDEILDMLARSPK